MSTGTSPSHGMGNAETENPLLYRRGLPDYAQIAPEHVEPAVTRVLQDVQEEFARCEPQFAPSWEQTVGLVEPLEERIARVWEPVSHLFSVKNSAALRAVYEQMQPAVVEVCLRLQQSQPLYAALRQLREGPLWEQLSATQQRIVADRLLDAELSGVGLPPEQRARFNEIEQQLSQLSTEFANHVLDATRAWHLDVHDPAHTEGWPATLKLLTSQAYHRSGSTSSSSYDSTRAETGPWRITLEAPIYVPFMEHCRIRELREQVYRAYITRAAAAPYDNSPLIRDILRLRREQAQLLGYRQYVEVSLAQKMADSLQSVLKMLEQLRQAAWSPALRERDELEHFARAAGHVGELAWWDIPFWAERLRQQRFGVTDEQLRPYFPLERVLHGLFACVHRLFGVVIRPTARPVSVWHDDVRYFDVYDAEGTLRAGFFLDPYSRPEDKRSGAWMDECLDRRRTAAGWQLPVAHLICNFTPPVGSQPALLTFDEVETLFHEMGHVLQHLLTEVDEPDAAGIRGIEWDAVELPSQFLENWCYHRDTLLGCSGHYVSGEPLPQEWFEQLCAARHYRAGSQLLRQLLFGLTDLKLHAEYDPDGSQSPFEVMHEVAQHTSVYPLLPEDRFLCSFQHIFAGGYAAGYYSYLWAEVLSADAFGAFEEAGLDDAEAVRRWGQRFRQTVLALGGSRHPADVFRMFRGRDPQIEPLLRQRGLLASA
ncbi:MAG: oligopeptidase A [Planctomycetaceae bacterium]|nr:MAG: oligopeptidase A [Planctomycetaceae bacterium]